MSWRATPFILAVCMLLLPPAAVADRTVVLATDESCAIDSINSLDVRKAYLGIAVSVDGHHVKPLRVTGDEQLERVFFQSIVAMSEKSYARRVLSLALKFGTPRPLKFERLASALEYIRQNTCSVVYAWADELDDAPGIKTLKPLWHGE